MEKISVIPSPAHRRWLAFRVQVLPTLTFILTLAAVVYLWRITVNLPRVKSGSDPLQAEKRSNPPSNSSGQVARLQR